MLLHFPAVGIIHDICSVNIIQDNGELSRAVLVISAQGYFSVYFVNEHSNNAFHSVSSPYAQIVETRSPITSKLTSLMFSLAKNILNTESDQYSIKSRNNPKKENEEIIMKPLFHWQDSGRAYLQTIEGLDYTVLTDSLGHYSIFHNFDGIIVRMIKEQRVSRCMWVVGKPNLLAIYRPCEKRIEFFQMPFESQSQSIRLSITDEHIVLRILAQAEGNYAVFMLDLTLAHLPKLIVSILSTENTVT